MEVVHYCTSDQKDVFQRWLDRLSDQRARRRILRRIDRIKLDGYIGDSKILREGVSELRVDEGAGYRIYFARSGEQVILLLCGGDKSSQDKDIARAVDFWKDYQSRMQP